MLGATWIASNPQGMDPGQALTLTTLMASITTIEAAVAVTFTRRFVPDLEMLDTPQQLARMVQIAAAACLLGARPEHPATRTTRGTSRSAGPAGASFVRGVSPQDAAAARATTERNQIEVTDASTADIGSRMAKGGRLARRAAPRGAHDRAR